jgi:phospholipid/cholesterol/gamma-HCH transport system substrate-binding protein
MKVETKVGMLFAGAVVLVAIFAYFMGAIGPFTSSHTLNLTYNFAGGIDVGSPVRVMGIKVGKVQDISFDPSMKTAKGEEVKLRIRISIDKKAWQTVRQDSRFYINLAGVIGEKFIEITPGTSESPVFEEGAFVRGEDPPRIDQLISQSYGLAGKILNMVEKNEGSVTDTIDMVDHLVTNLNKTLALLDKASQRKDFQEILKNVTQITGDLATVTPHLRGPEAEKTYDLLYRLIWRLDPLDEKAIRKFFQQEGVRAKIF